ncbi:MAG: hypothetical protein WC069_05975 [Candidatus Shapirobacteria bacterium]
MGENYFDGSVNAGSPGVPNPNVLPAATAATPGAGETSTVSETEAKELQSLVGRQGQELGEFRKFFSDIAPLLDKLDKSPEIVQAIVDGNITADLAKAAMEGKITIADAQLVTKAEEEVKKDLGKKGYEGASAEEVARLIDEKAKEISSSFQKELKERDELSAFESNVNDFIARTPDFAQYASEIDKWLDSHEVTDIAVAYYAVKGELSVKEANKQAEIDKAEAEKNFALNAGGSQGGKTYIPSGSNVIDSLISSKANPNLF